MQLHNFSGVNILESTCNIYFSINLEIDTTYSLFGENFAFVLLTISLNLLFYRYTTAAKKKETVKSDIKFKNSVNIKHIFLRKCLNNFRNK